MKLAIVIVTGKVNLDGSVNPRDEPVYHGLFRDGDVATRWAFDNLKGFEWHWQDIWVQTNMKGNKVEIRETP